MSEAESHNNDRDRRKQRGRVAYWFALVFGSIGTAFCWLRGKKTYLLAVGTAVYALLGLVLGEHDLNETGRLLFDAAALAGLRAGVNNAVQKVKE